MKELIKSDILQTKPKVKTMLNTNFQINSGISKTAYSQNITGFALPKNMETNPVEKTEFKNVLSDLANNLNTEMNAPDKLLTDLVSGRNGVDVADVMTAMSKAEISVTVATTAVTKVIQAYDKISQIQV